MSGTVTIEADHIPPRVRIDTTAQIVTRLEGDSSEAIPVRGSVVGGVIYDYECPQETPVTYLDGQGLIVTVEMPDVGVWLIPPSAPELGAQLLVGADGFSGWSRPSGAVSVRIPGRANSVSVDFGRGAREGSLETVVLEADEFAALSTCLDVSGPKFLSFPASHWPAFGLVSWVVCGDVDEKPLGFSEQQTWTVTFPLTPIDRPVFVESMSGGAIEDLVGTISGLQGTIGDLGA